jgi:hypothetical protein
MNSLSRTPISARALPLPGPSDYYARALALWPRVDRVKLARVRHDPGRVAVLISHRTTLSLGAILELLGAPRSPADASEQDN